jgi:phosphoenolpyruvate synthase/pyruvate phosphate dikinase
MTATATRTEILDLADCHEVALVGEKAHTLGRLLRAGYNVPPGVVLTSESFARHHGDGTTKCDALDGSTLELLVAASPNATGRPVVVRSSAIG